MSNEQQDQGGTGVGPHGASPSAGWYQDPWDGHRRRYWDGQQWTGDVSFEPPHNWGGDTEGAGERPAYGAQASSQWQSPGAPTPGGYPDPTVPQANVSQADVSQGNVPQASLPHDGSSQPPAPSFPAVAQQGWGGQAPQAGVAQWPGATQEHPTQVGWGGWGQPPHLPPGVYAGGTPMWPYAPQPPQSGTNRVHVAIVALIAAVAVLAGIGIGSQINATSSTSAASTGNGVPAPGSGTFTNPFGGGSGSVPSGGSTGSGSSGGAPGSSSLSSAQKAVVARVDRSVVDINTDLGYQNSAAAGTGMVLNKSGAILTNNHVIDGATSVSVTVVSTGKTFKADVVGTDSTQDVAVLQIENPPTLTPVALGDSSGVGRGDSVIAIGNAGGAGGLPSAVTGSVSALDQTITASDSNGTHSEMLNGLIQTNAPIQPGDSGGPLVNSKGQVIGMDTAASSGNANSGASTSVGFAIPISNATTVASQIQRGQASATIHIGATGFLGVQVTSGGSTGGAAGSLGGGGTTTVSGANVVAVVPNSPADKAGIVAGDTITVVDGTTITSASALTTALRSRHPGDQVGLTWVDTAGASHSGTLTLTTGPAA